ncbi:hypothetical protein TSTA_091620 [Talaromyces stipitatus ATCC 10500]|uniref:Uncharacterized protein n=1 Tax=Talaromyces stipitatus (strain ATCC 10500 / CBS 375.48 / QM 6759 / NRRL 1006) TaxID=441959 RepID=B8M2L0_TALSN|nr:uncharacterized protein TSTA_091620 [Talaromyces stipitatus ATCC 10500]EED21921.1 hypothetical protein TSTA_091620 [Talaromyces stipitatus ATCC 10500]
MRFLVKAPALPSLSTSPTAYERPAKKVKKEDGPVLSQPSAVIKEELADNPTAVAASTERMPTPCWEVTQYLLSETDPDYDERHALSQALKAWVKDAVSDLSTPRRTTPPSSEDIESLRSIANVLSTGALHHVLLSRLMRGDGSGNYIKAFCNTSTYLILLVSGL